MRRDRAVHLLQPRGGRCDHPTIRDASAHWLNVLDMTDRALDERIVADGIDILMDMHGHSGGHRLMVFARKPAPVSFSWIGYFATTGLTAIDYVLANRWVVPEGEEGQWTETPWRLPDTYLCYATPRDALPTTPLPALAAGPCDVRLLQQFQQAERCDAGARGRRCWRRCRTAG